MYRTCLEASPWVKILALFLYSTRFLLITAELGNAAGLGTDVSCLCVVFISNSLSVHCVLLLYESVHSDYCAKRNRFLLSNSHPAWGVIHKNLSLFEHVLFPRLDSIETDRRH